MNTKWKITYTTKSGGVQTTDFDWFDREPTKNQVAIGIRDKLLPDGFLLPDMRRGSGDAAVFLLKSYGFEVVGIDRISN